MSTGCRPAAVALANASWGQKPDNLVRRVDQQIGMRDRLAKKRPSESVGRRTAAPSWRRSYRSPHVGATRLIMFHQNIVEVVGQVPPARLAVLEDVDPLLPLLIDDRVLSILLLHRKPQGQDPHDGNHREGNDPDAQRQFDHRERSGVAATSDRRWDANAVHGWGGFWYFTRPVSAETRRMWLV